ncbi:hypothetical protein WJX77_008577 [Trebouxia sp. C0004]
MEREINLSQLQAMKEAFDTADEEGTGELDMDTFKAKMAPHLGSDITDTALVQLFMKIDADCGGTVDWEEFTNYFFLRGVDGPDQQEWKFFPQDFKSKNDPATYHREDVTKIYCTPGIDKYISCGRDGSMRLWSPADLSLHRTIANGPAWVTDCVYMPTARRLVCASADRAISYYDISRGVYDLAGRVKVTGTMGVPLCLSSAVDEKSEQENIIYGDDSGAAIMLQCGKGELPARLLKPGDFQYVHDDHTDWVTQVSNIHELGLVTCSLDSTIKITDLSRCKVLHTVTAHRRGVHCFAHSKAFSLCASGGLERDILLWQGSTNRQVGEMTGHAASISHIAIDNRRCQVVSMAADNVIKVWDLRNHRCIQTIADVDWPSQEDAHPSAMMYDPARSRMVTAFHRLAVWPHMCVSDDNAGHEEPLVAALYNNLFQVVISGDESGTICMWNIHTGERQGHFKHCHGHGRLTAMTLDAQERRLLTGSNSGELKMWNFNSGSQLREFAHREEHVEYSALRFVHDADRQSSLVVATGWNHKVLLWQDEEADKVSEYRMFSGHREDVQCMAYVAPYLLATGDYGGRICIWNIFTGERRFTLTHEAAEFQRGVEQLLFLRPHDPHASPILLSCGGDGGMRVWRVSSTPALMCTIRAAVNRLDCVNSTCCDAQHEHVVVGDTGGHVRVWKLDPKLSSSTGAAAEACFTQLACWRAHPVGISSVQCAGVHGVGGGDLLLVASQDCTVSLWSLQGGLVGVLGKHTWALPDAATWQDAKGVRTPAAIRETGESAGWQATDADTLEESSTSDDGNDFQEWASPADQVLAMRRIRGDKHATIAAMHRAVDAGYSALTLHDASALPENPVGRKIAVHSSTGSKVAQMPPI